MIDGATLRSSLVAFLRDIPALVAMHDNDPENILEYVEHLNGDLFGTVFALAPPKLLVVHQGSGPSGDSARLYQQSFSLMVRNSSYEPSTILVAIVDGVPQILGTGLPMIQTQIHPSYSPMEIPTSRRTVIPVSEKSSKDYWEITTSFKGRSFD